MIFEEGFVPPIEFVVGGALIVALLRKEIQLGEEIEGFLKLSLSLYYLYAGNVGFACCCIIL